MSSSGTLPRCAGFTMAMAWHERMHDDVRHRWLREQLLAVAAEVA